MTKTCKKCLRELPATNFYRSDRNRDGLTGDCKECRKRRRHELYPPKGRQVGPKEQLSGQRLGGVVVLSYVGRVKQQTKWSCQCDCGNVFDAEQYRLKQGLVQNCGCRRRFVGPKKKHGMSADKICLIWHSMIARCHKPHSTAYRDYGSRGITVCERWRESLLNFVDDMGPRPSDRHSIDRIDVNGNYEPSNCRWATNKEQMRNTRRNVNITFNGKTQCMKDWSVELGIHYDCIIGRIRSGMDPAAALAKGPAKPPAAKRYASCEVCGREFLARHSGSAACDQKCGVKLAFFRRRGYWPPQKGEAA